MNFRRIFPVVLAVVLGLTGTSSPGMTDAQSVSGEGAAFAALKNDAQGVLAKLNNSLHPQTTFNTLTAYERAVFVRYYLPVSWDESVSMHSSGKNGQADGGAKTYRSMALAKQVMKSQTHAYAGKKCWVADHAY